MQRRRRRSGWSGLGRTTFQRVVGLVPRLQGRSEDETIGPGVPRKLAFAVRVRVSRNRSRSLTGGSGAQRGPTGLHQHPRVAKYTCVYDVQLLAIWRIPLLAVVLLLSLALRVGLLRRLPTSPCPYTTVWKEERCVQIFSAKLVCFLVALLVCCRSPPPFTCMSDLLVAVA